MEHQHTVLPVLAMQTCKYKCRYISTHSLPLHHMEESGWPLLCQGKKSQFPSLRSAPEPFWAFLSTWESPVTAGSHGSYPSLYTNWALPFPNQNGIHQWILVINFPVSIFMKIHSIFLGVLHRDKQINGYMKWLNRRSTGMQMCLYIVQRNIIHHSL